MTMQAVEVEIEDDVPDTVFKIPVTKATVKAAELSIIVPTFNERDNIKAVIAAVSDALPNIAWEVIFVDDNSSDGTASFVREIARIDPRVRCLHRFGRRGLSSACVEGIMSTASPIVAVMDADRQHDESALFRMFEILNMSSGAVIPKVGAWAIGIGAAPP